MKSNINYNKSLNNLNHSDKQDKSPIIRKCKIEDEIEFTRLDKYMGNRFSYYSRNKWQEIISYGLVLVNGVKTKYTKLLKKGDEIEYHIIDLKEPEVNKDIKILYDDGDLIIANKPANLPVIPSGRYYYNTFHTLMCKSLNIKLNMLNRIDRETSGCIALCRSHEMASKFSYMIKENRIKKIYLAIVENASNIENNFVVEGNMIEIGNDYYRRYQTFTKCGGKYSKTSFQTIKRFGHYAIVKALLHTGRMHQIRVHIKEKGYFLVGDKIYGKYGAKIFDEFVGNKKSVNLQNIFERQALHAYKLSFIHPFTGKIVNIKAPLPKDLKYLIKNIRNNY